MISLREYEGPEMVTTCCEARLGSFWTVPRKSLRWWKAILLSAWHCTQIPRHHLSSGDRSRVLMESNLFVRYEYL